MKPYAESCDENREPILSVIQSLLKGCSTVFEVGSGTGQHAVYFAEKLPHLVWYTSDCSEHHAGIKMWLQEAGLENTPAPVELNVSTSAWPQQKFDAVFSANTVHIMHWSEVEAMFAGAGAILSGGGRFMLYGPFNYDNQYTSESNASFDSWLKSRDPESGIKNFEDLDKLAQQAGMLFRYDYEMPANNRILYWEKSRTS
jgi:cyclopropane fatty-acyl-phospholipid synthase-like methyltransferase